MPGVDKLDGMTIYVQAPDSKLIRGRRIHVNQLFVFDEFVITVTTPIQNARFSTELVSWLLALSKYLRSGASTKIDEQILIGGDRLTIAPLDNGCRVQIDDLDKLASVPLDLTMIQLRALHGRLVAELTVAAHRAADGFVEIDGLELLDIDGKPAQ